MKKIVSFVLSLAFAGSTFAQMSGYSSSSYSDGTALGSNETLTADGIALGNAVKLRGNANFLFSSVDYIEDSIEDSRFTTSADVDFLFDLSPITSELHLEVNRGGVDLEQLFARYSFNSDFNLSFGRQVTALGYESDERVNLLGVVSGYSLTSFLSNPVLRDSLSSVLFDINSGFGTALSTTDFPKFRKNYVDGVRANYNNGMFGFTFGIHDNYWGGIDAFNSGNNDNLGIDIAASVMFMPGLEAQLGYAHQSTDDGTVNGETDISQFNGWIAWNPDDLTLAFEFDNFDFDHGDEAWDIMLLAHYQFTDIIGASFRYSHEDWEFGTLNIENDRISLAMLLAITEHFDMKFEYAHTSTDVSVPGASGDADSDELYIESIVSF
jgi:hypothetical protein